MTEPDVYSALSEIFSEVFMRSDIAMRPELNADDVEGWDSYKQIEIIMAVEERFHIKLRTKEIDGLANVGDLAKVILQKAA